MRKLILLFLLALPVQAHNLLLFQNYYWAIDYGRLKKIQIDNSFSPEFKTSMTAFLNEYFDVPITFKDLNGNNAFETDVLNILKFSDLDYPPISGAGIWRASSTVRQIGQFRLTTKSYIVTPENFNTFRHEIGHALGLDHETRQSKAIERKQKPIRWFKQDDLLLADQIMTTGGSTSRQFTPMDRFMFKVLSDKETAFGAISGVLGGTANGDGDIVFILKGKGQVRHKFFRKTKIRKNGAYRPRATTRRQRYLFSVNDRNEFLAFLPHGNYQVFYVPVSGKPVRVFKDFDVTIGTPNLKALKTGTVETLEVNPLEIE